MESLDFKKSTIRDLHLKKRMNMTFAEKKEKDKKIFENFLALDIILKFNIFLVYVSKDIEVDTIKIIKYCLKNKKKVAVPICFKKDFSMDFYFIDSLKDLHFGSFSVLEPEPNDVNMCCELDIKRSICIIPGMVYNLFGHRIGYGKGFYDRFLSKFSCFKLGICYDFNVVDCAFNEFYDVAVDLLLTEKRLFKFFDNKENLN